MSKPAYAIAYLRDGNVGADIVEYLEAIDATLDEFGGRFLVHGSRLTPLEGERPGDVVIIEFGSREAAEQWYASPGYQRILPLRTENSNGRAAIVDGVEPGYRAATAVAKLLAAAESSGA